MCVVVDISTHNEQIQRLLRDVHHSVLVTFGNLFCELAEEGHLDVLNEVDMFCLHTVHFSRINKSLSEFAASWNNHAILTEGIRTLLQLSYVYWADGCEQKLKQR